MARASRWAIILRSERVQRAPRFAFCVPRDCTVRPFGEATKSGVRQGLATILVLENWLVFERLMAEADGQGRVAAC